METITNPTKSSLLINTWKDIDKIQCTSITTWTIELYTSTKECNIPPVPEATSEEYFTIIDSHLGLVLFVSVKEKIKTIHLLSLKKRRVKKKIQQRP